MMCILFNVYRFPPITKHDLHIMSYKIYGSMVEYHMLNKHIKPHAYDILQSCVFVCGLDCEKYKLITKHYPHIMNYKLWNLVLSHTYYQTQVNSHALDNSKPITKHNVHLFLTNIICHTHVQTQLTYHWLELWEKSKAIFYCHALNYKL
jgi:hypothetical protein